MRKGTLATGALGLAAALSLGGCTLIAGLFGGEEEPTVTPPPLFADSSLTHYVKGVDTPAGDEIAMISAWDGSGSVAIGADGAATGTFTAYPAWWGSGIAYVQKPEAAAGSLDLSGVKTISFEIKSSDILPAELGVFLQWLGATGTGGEYTFTLPSLGVTSLADWTRVTVDLSTLPETGTDRYGKAACAFVADNGNKGVDTAFAIKWLGDAHTDPNTGTLAAGDSYSIRDISFEDATGAAVDISGTIAYVAPLLAPADPTAADADVISYLTTKTYTTTAANIAWHPSWKGTGTVADLTIGGKAVKFYSLVDFDIIEATPLDLAGTGMTALHLDVWSPDMAALKIKLVDYGADGAYSGGDDTEKELTETLTLGQWVGLDIPLADFQVASGLAAPANHLAQMVLSPAGSLYLTNLYFHK